MFSFDDMKYNPFNLEFPIFLSQKYIFLFTFLKFLNEEIQPVQIQVVSVKLRYFEKLKLLSEFHRNLQ